MPESPRAAAGIVFALAIVTGSFLLFLVQPLMAAVILPWFGGAAAVWTTSMLFFQTVLLAGYAYAHGLARWPLRRQAMVHAALVIVAVVALPISPDPALRPTDTNSPARDILWLLVTSVGLPYFVLSTTSTLMQAWIARMGAQAPYRLYAVSNVASMAALFAYPFLVEPALGARAQAAWWGYAFIGFAVISLGAALLAGRAPASASDDTARERPTARAFGTWVALAALPSALLLAVTETITTDVSVVPFFWILPLALYLLTFIVAFAQERSPTPGRLAAAVALGLICFAPAALWPGLALATQVGLGCGGLFLICLALHGELVRRRPPPAQLTAFYLGLSVGGALGGASVLLAPLLLTARWELPILLGVTALVMLALRRREAWLLPIAGAVIWVIVVPRFDAEVVEQRRSFYGTVRVEMQRPRGPDGPVVRHLVDGRVSHGLQQIDRPRQPSGYYHPTALIGVPFARLTPPRKLGLIGLGAGSLTVYGRAGDTFRIYELNPDVADLARTRFTYLRESEAAVDVVLGDARLSMAREAPNGFDLLIIDAFSGDAVPAHLLTVEAFDLWARHLAPGGLLAIHVSNHHLDLARAVYRQTKRLGWTTHIATRRTPSPLGPYSPQWVIAGPAAAMEAVGLGERPPPTLDGDGPAPLWTDDHTPLWPLLR